MINKNSLIIRGFTLLEVLITIAVLAILLIIATPSFQVIISKNNAIFYCDEFVMALNLAKSEAIQRNTPVSICPINGVGSPNCNSNNWRNGWIVFVDVNAGGNLQNASDKLLIHDPLDRVVVSTNIRRITFSDTSEVLLGDGNIVLRGNICYGTNAKEISVSKIGKISQKLVACP